MFKRSSPRPTPTLDKEHKERKERKERKDHREQSFLQSGVRVEGGIHTQGDLRVDGQVNGKLRISGMLTVGPKAKILGDVHAQTIVIHGVIEGRLQADDRIHLARGARVKADLYCGSLVIDEGVFFKGRSHMGEKLSAGDAHATEEEQPARSMAGVTVQSGRPGDVARGGPASEARSRGGLTPGPAMPERFAPMQSPAPRQKGGSDPVRQGKATGADHQKRP